MPRLCSRLRRNRNKRWVFHRRPSSTSDVSNNRGGRLFFLRGIQEPYLCRHAVGSEGALMSRNLSLEEQRDFWTELFAVVIRHDARKRAALEVTLELLDDVLQTEQSQP